MASRPSMEELDRLVAELRQIETMRAKAGPGDAIMAELDDAEAEARARMREVTKALELRRTLLELETELASLEDKYREVVGEEPDFPTERVVDRDQPRAAAGRLSAVRAVEDPNSRATLEERIRRVRLRIARLGKRSGH